MSPTVDHPAAEREPDHVTPCGACDGSGTTGSLDTDVFECTVCDGTGLSAQHRSEPDPWTSRATLACSATGEHQPHPWTSATAGSVHCAGLDPRQYAPAIDWSAYEACPSCWAQSGPCLVLGGYEALTPHPDRARKPVAVVAPDVHLRIAIGDPIPCGSTTVRASTANPAEVTCAGCRPQRRTASVETLTDELRNVPMDYEPETGATIYVPAGARVGVIVRYADKPVQVTDVDSEWKRDKRSYTAADVLGLMLLRARFVADDHQAELVMPLPDVLAALDGRPDAQLLTAPVHVLALDVEPGMLLADFGDALLQRVDRVGKCEKPDCDEGASCVVFTVDGGTEEHQGGYARTRVRIPAAVTR